MYGAQCHCSGTALHGPGVIRDKLPQLDASQQRQGIELVFDMGLKCLCRRQLTERKLSYGWARRANLYCLLVLHNGHGDGRAFLAEALQADPECPETRRAWQNTKYVLHTHHPVQATRVWDIPLSAFWTDHLVDSDFSALVCSAGSKSCSGGWRSAGAVERGWFNYR